MQEDNLIIQVSSTIVYFYLFYDGPIDVKIDMSPSDKKSVWSLWYSGDRKDP